VSRRELFAKLSSLLVALEITLFQTLSKIHDHRWGSEQRPIWKLTVLRRLKTPVFWPQRDQAHAEQPSPYQSVYQPHCSAFRHSWISPQRPITCVNLVLPSVTREDRPKIFSTGCTVSPLTCSMSWLVFLKRYITSFFSVLIFIPLGLTQLIVYQGMLKIVFRWCNHYQIVRKCTRLILQLPTVAPSSTQLIVCPIQTEQTIGRIGDSTCPCRSLTPTVNGCNLASLTTTQIRRSNTVTWLTTTSNRRSQHHKSATLKGFHEDPSRMLSRVSQNMCRCLRHTPKIYWNLLESENLICSATGGPKIALGMLQLRFYYLAECFSKTHSVHFSREAKGREIPYSY